MSETDAALRWALEELREAILRALLLAAEDGHRDAVVRMCTETLALRLPYIDRVDDHAVGGDGRGRE